MASHAIDMKMNKVATSALMKQPTNSSYPSNHSTGDDSLQQ
jgi:hypothetical protein